MEQYCDSLIVEGESLSSMTKTYNNYFIWTEYDTHMHIHIIYLKIMTFVIQWNRLILLWNIRLCELFGI